MAKCPSSHSDEEKKKKNLRQRKKNGRKKGIKTVIKGEFILAGDNCWLDGPGSKFAHSQIYKVTLLLMGTSFNLNLKKDNTF